MNSKILAPTVVSAAEVLFVFGIKSALAIHENLKSCREKNGCPISATPSGSFKILFRGVLLPLTTIPTANACRIVLDQKILDLFPFAKDNNNPSLEAVVVAGAISGSVYGIFRSPVDLITTHMQLQKCFLNGAALKGPMDIWRGFGKSGNYKKLFRGLPATVIRNGIGFPLFCVSFQMMKSGTHNPTQELVAAGTAAAVTSALLYPVDVLKEHLEKDGVLQKSPKYNGMIDCARKTFRYGGLRALATGMLVSVVFAFPAGASDFWATSKIEDIYKARIVGDVCNKKGM